MTAVDDPVIYRIIDNVAWIELNRPERLNAANPELVEALVLALHRATEEGVGAAVLTGAGRAFCSGFDLSFDRTDRTPDVHRRHLERAHDVTRAIRGAPFGVVAAVHGYALGNGCEFALAADAVIAAHGTEFAFPEVTWGLGVTGGLTGLLVTSIGAHRTKRLMLSGDRFSADEARQWGLLHSVVPEDERHSAAARLAQHWASMPRGGFSGIKHAIDSATRHIAEQAFAIETDNALDASVSREADLVIRQTRRGTS